MLTQTAKRLCSSKILLFSTLITFLVLLISNTKKTYAQSADITAPVTTHTQTPSSPDGSNGWYKSVVQFDLTATDIQSGIKEINYRIDTGSWQKVTFSNSLNLAQNPSFETPDASTSGLSMWEASVLDGLVQYEQDIGESAAGFEAASARITSTGGTWHGINNQTNYAVAQPYDSMSASAWVKTQNLTGTAYFVIYAIAPDPMGGPDIVQQIGQSGTITGTTGWTQLSLSFTVSLAGATGVYMDIGGNGTGIIWADAVSINSSTTSANTTFTVGSDSANHTVEYYSVDNAGNSETYTCTNPKKNCVTFKSDMTPPGNWNDSGAFRGFFGASHELYVYTNVEDATSGLSVFTDKYQYKTDNNATFGRYSNISSCNSTWQPDNWVILISPPFQPGVHSAYLLTPKTNFCNSNWKICKIVRFYAEDMAGNAASKDFCINGPWISFLGKGFVRSNNIIDMLSEAPDDNTDSLIEALGNTISFFSSSRNWKVTNATPVTAHDYDYFYGITPSSKTAVTGSVVSSSGVYEISGDYELRSNTVPSNYDNNVFNQIVFVDGNLIISTEMTLNNQSTALYVVNGNVEISKSVTDIDIAIIAEGFIDTGYDINEGEATSTLNFNGIYAADTFKFKRTLQGTNNDDVASEIFTFGAKYILQLKDYFGNSSIRWSSVE